MVREKKIPAAEKVVAYIHAYIKQNGLEPGDALPTERDIAKAIGLSRATVREGMGRLRFLGFVESKTKRGARLANADARDVLTTVVPTLAQTKAQFRDLAEFRVMVETGAVLFAAARRTARDMAALEEIIALEQEAIKKGTAAYNVQDKAFHLTLMEAAHNGLILVIGDVIASHIDNVLTGEASRSQQEAIMTRSHLEHTLIVKAIKKRDAAGAVAVMRMHVESTLEGLGAIA